jgi:hypothetical protein
MVEVQELQEHEGTARTANGGSKWRRQHTAVRAKAGRELEMLAQGPFSSYVPPKHQTGSSPLLVSRGSQAWRSSVSTVPMATSSRSPALAFDKGAMPKLWKPRLRCNARSAVAVREERRGCHHTSSQGVRPSLFQITTIYIVLPWMCVLDIWFPSSVRYSTCNNVERIFSNANGDWRASWSWHCLDGRGKYLPQGNWFVPPIYPY